MCRAVDQHAASLPSLARGEHVVSGISQHWDLVQEKICHEMIENSSKTPSRYVRIATNRSSPRR